jgi:hypothetical protein
MLFNLPEGASQHQIDTYAKNCKLYELAFENRNRYGVLIGLCCDLGSQDSIFWDKQNFINVYPYSSAWMSLAYGSKFRVDISCSDDII